MTNEQRTAHWRTLVEKHAESGLSAVEQKKKAKTDKHNHPGRIRCACHQLQSHHLADTRR